MASDDAFQAPSAEDEWAAALAEQAEKTASSQAQALAAGTQAESAANLFQRFDTAPSAPTSGPAADIDLILDIPVQMTVELGRTRIPIKHILQLAQGSVVELDGMAGEPMNVLVNGCLIAQGEVVVVNERFGIRLTDIITPSERIRKLNR